HGGGTGSGGRRGIRCHRSWQAGTPAAPRKGGDSAGRLARTAGAGDPQRWCPSVLLPESLEARGEDRVLRAPSAPVPAVPVGLSRVFAASGGIGPERLRAFAPSAARASPVLLPPLPGDYSAG